MASPSDSASAKPEMTLEEMRAERDRIVREMLTRRHRDELKRKDYEYQVACRLSAEFGDTVIGRLTDRLSLEGKRFLDVGAGFGEMSVAAAKQGAVAYGVEPDAEKHRAADLWARVNGVEATFVAAYGEDLPFEDDFFDVVLCNDVLEHVGNARESLAEMVRVLKPGGTLYLRVANYLYPHEEHYDVTYPPLLPRPLMRLYLRMRRRDTGLFEHIHYVTTRTVFGELKKHDVEITNVGLEKFLAKMPRNPLKAALKRMVARLGAYPSIELLVRKRPVSEAAG